MISQMNTNQRTTLLSDRAGAGRARGSLRGVLPALLLALLGVGCGERFQLAEVAQGLDDEATGELSFPVLADGTEDADAVLQDSGLGRALGDVDGDGYDDWLSAGPRVRYGHPRPADGVFETPQNEGPSFRLGDDAEALLSYESAGDVNGDGYADIVFSTSMGLSRWYELEVGANLAEMTETEASVAQAWTEQRAFLWYGGPDRTAGARELGDVAVKFPSSEHLPELFAAELTERQSPRDEWYEAGQAVGLMPLGDMDGDGYDDLAWRASFSWHGARLERHADHDESIQTGQRTEAVTYVFYGSADPLPSNPVPAARLPGVFSLRAVGDVNGDGFADVQALAGNETRLLAGSAARLSGELAIDDIGVPMLGALQYPAQSIGDIDNDGTDDLFVLWEIINGENGYYLFYGSATLLAAPLEKSAANAMFAVHGPFADVSPGDWDGDGVTDLVLSHARIVTDSFSPLAGSEVRLIPGSVERYSGEHTVSTYRPDATIDPTNLWGGSVPGDIDGDGFADLFLGTLPDQRTVFVKYGRPLSRPIH